MTQQQAIVAYATQLDCQWEADLYEVLSEQPISGSSVRLASSNISQQLLQSLQLTTTMEHKSADATSMIAIEG